MNVVGGNPTLLVEFAPPTGPYFFSHKKQSLYRTNILINFVNLRRILLWRVF